MPDERLFAIEPEILLSPEPSHSSKEFRAKSPGLQQLINEALVVLFALGVPPYETPRIRSILATLLASDQATPGRKSAAARKAIASRSGSRGSVPARCST